MHLIENTVVGTSRGLGPLYSWSLYYEVGLWRSHFSIQVPLRNFLPYLAQLLTGLLIPLNKLSGNKSTLTEQSDRCIKYQTISEFIKNTASHMEDAIHFPSQLICGERISFSNIHFKIRSRETEIYKRLILDVSLKVTFKLWQPFIRAQWI